MYCLPPHYKIQLGEQPSTVMYASENFHKDIDVSIGGSGSQDVFSAATPGKVLVLNGISVVPKHVGKSKPVSHHGISDFEARQLAVLSQLQQLRASLDKLSGISDNKKRTGTQAKDVKRQKTESSCQDIQDDPPVPETIDLTEQPNFSAYETKATLGTQFPLNIFVSHTAPLPYALLVLASLVRERAAPAIRIGIKAFVHSSIDEVDCKIKSRLQEFYTAANDGVDSSHSQHTINIIWAKGSHPNGPLLLHGTCVESQTATIVGELAIAKYLGSLIGFYPTPGFAPQGTFLSLDYWLYTADSFARSAYPEVRPNILKEMEGVLERRRFLMGDRVTFADVVVWSVFRQSGVSLRRSSLLQLSPNVKNWFLILNSVKQFRAARVFVI